MILKERRKSVRHQVLEALSYRTELTEEDLKKLQNQVKGYEGEVQFDEYARQLAGNVWVLQDLLLPYEDTTFQLDALVARGETLYHYEVKNYTGEYTQKGGVLRSQYQTQIMDPESQIGRANTMLHNTIRRLGYHFEIKSYYVYINPAFHLYSERKMDAVLFAGQLPQHFRELNKKSDVESNKMKQLLHELMKLHDPHYRPNKMPHYEHVRRGVVCGGCHSFELIKTRENLICAKCHHKETALSAIARTANEFHLIYPDKKITVLNVLEWCNHNHDRQQIRRSLEKYFIRKETHKSTYYIPS